MKKRYLRPWKEELKDLFSMHAAERRGFLVLLSLCFVAAGWVIYEQWIRPSPVDDLAKLQVAYAELKLSAGSSIDPEQRSDRQVVVEHLTLFKFDPNDLPSEQWVALGLSERQADVIHHYEDKGGRFRTKRDVAKMRVVDPDLFAKWEPFIQLPDSLPKHEFEKYGDHQKYVNADHPAFAKDEERHFTRNLVEINTADTNQLIELPGIGPAFARGIVKYRDRLGGFRSLDQLNEVWVLRDKPDAVAKLKTLLVIDTQMVRLFPIMLMMRNTSKPAILPASLVA